MKIELVPDPGPEDAAARAALAALEEEGLAREPRPAGLDAPWRLAGLEHALDRDVQRKTPVYRRSSRETPTSG